jgi:hypothetical protein
MSGSEDTRAQTAAIKAKVKQTYDRRRSAAIALCLHYAGMALQRFRQKQASNKFWDNQTKVALDTVFSDAIVTDGAVGFFLAHLVEYGVYLELANDRKNQALVPTVMAFYSRFHCDLEALYGS